MNQKIFETRQRAEELLQEAIEVWRQSDESERLEGLENDPVFKMIITALAYQANELESDIARFRQDVVSEFYDSLLPYQAGHAIPATVAIETALQGDTPDIVMTSDMGFALGDGEFIFSPVLATHLYNMHVLNVARIDGRRWKVSIEFPVSTKSIEGLSFALQNCNFREMRVTYKGELIKLISPWDYASMPMCQNFDFATSMWNQTDVYNPSSIFMDLYARHNLQMYIIDKDRPKNLPQGEFSQIDLIFEFFDIPTDFQFGPENLILNPVVLAEVRRRVCTLTSAQPVSRITSGQFMHLLPPIHGLTNTDINIEVRRIAADRFNRAALIHLLSSLIDKVHSDFYAFQSFAKDISLDHTKQQLIDLLNKIRSNALQHGSNDENVRGTYFVLRNSAQSCDFMYLTTSGSKVNSVLSENSSFMVPLGLDQNKTRQITPPMPGFDEVRDETAQQAVTRYYNQTADRLVTPADIKIFSMQLLMARYGIPAKSILDIKTCMRADMDRQSGYFVSVSIRLEDNSFIRRNLNGKLQSMSQLIEKMIQVRSMSIYPVHVEIALG